MTTEYRRGLIHTTLAASPRRSRVLVAKAIVLGAVTFAAGLAGAVVAVPLGERLARANGVYLFPVTPSAELRVELGTAALLATASILALAIGTMFRRSAGAVTTVIVAIVLPYLLIANPFMPARRGGLADPGDTGRGLRRPADACAVSPGHEHLHAVQRLLPAGAVGRVRRAGGYAVVSLAVAAVLLRRRDA